jgi:hypothetical protein
MRPIVEAGPVRIGIGLQRLHLRAGDVLQEWDRTSGNLRSLGAGRRAMRALRMKIVSQRREQAKSVQNHCCFDVKKEVPA